MDARRSLEDQLPAIERLPAERVIAESRTTQTALVVVPGYGRVVRKRWWWPRRRDRAKGLLRTTIGVQSPARREHAALTRLRERVDPPFAPRPLGHVDTRSRGVLSSCMLVLEEIVGARDLASWLAAHRHSTSRGIVLLDLARRIRAMHDAGLVDREMHPRNVLVDPAGRTWKVDCPKQSAGRGRASRSGAVDDLACLDVGLVRLCSAKERLAFFAAYADDDDDERLVAAVTRRRARHDAKESKRLPS